MKKYTKEQMRVGNDRLAKLVHKLQYEVPEEQFDYNQWVGNDWGGRADLSCGTSACALGWATTIPSFRKLGLRLQRDSMGSADVVNVKTGVNNAFSVAENLFSISREQSYRLFSPQAGESAATAIEVAVKIQRFVDAREEVLDLLN